MAPYIVGLITSHELQSEWRIVFFISAGIFFIGGIVFVLFGSSDVEKWSIIRKENEEDFNGVGTEKEEIK